MFPREFRIDGGELSGELAAALDGLAGLLATVEPPRESDPPAPVSTPAPSAPPSPGVDVLMKPIADVSTGLWRLRQQMLEPGTDRPRDEMRRSFRHLVSTLDALSDAGIRIQDHTNDPFRLGLSLKVLAYQPVEGLTKEKIIETIRPSIYYKDKRIQMGEVVVGTPEEDSPIGNSGGQRAEHH
jgi:hypothetical protein